MVSEKVMFEIYREADFNRRYRVVYYTELTEHNREHEINHALDGEHVMDGFLRNWRRDEAKAVIAAALARWNNGEAPDVDALVAGLGEHLV